MMKIYGIKNCNTMKKAFIALDEQGIDYTFHDYKKQGIDQATLQQWLKQKDQDVILNKKGTTWRKLCQFGEMIDIKKLAKSQAFLIE
jgi:Spx/MgsR family transcriptional regulator